MEKSIFRNLSDPLNGQFEFDMSEIDLRAVFKSWKRTFLSFKRTENSNSQNQKKQKKPSLNP